MESLCLTPFTHRLTSFGSRHLPMQANATLPGKVLGSRNVRAGLSLHDMQNTEWNLGGLTELLASVLRKFSPSKPHEGPIFIV